MERRELGIPPAVVMLATIGLMTAVDRTVPGPRIELPGAAIAAAVLAAAGAAVALAGVATVRRAGTTVNPLKPESSSRLVVRGIFRVSRNPIYLGMLLLVAACGASLEHPLAWAGPVAFFVAMDRIQIPREERALAGTFGDAWHAYAGRVRRWI